MNKKPFVTKEQVEEIVKTYPTPFHIYDEKGIRENVKALKEAFSWNPGYKEYFAVKATPNPFLIDILKEYGCGCDCSSYTELMLSEAVGVTGQDIMFSSNDTPAEDFALADKLGAIINLDDITHIDFLEKTIGHIINGDTIGTLNNVVLMCLAAHLPWEMSDYLIQRSGHKLLLNNDDHNWYRFVLKNMYPKEIPEIQAFLQEQGASPL